MTNRRLGLALVASIAANVFLLGAGATIFVLEARARPASGAQRLTFNAAASSLSEAHRAAFMELLKKEGEIVQTENRQARLTRDRAWASLSSVSFDPDAAKAELAQARVFNIQARGQVESSVIDFATGLPRDERSAFGQAMRRAISRQHVGASAGAPRGR